jgi:hypothetical protein
MLHDATNIPLLLGASAAHQRRISGASAARSQESNPSEFKIRTTFMFQNLVFMNRYVFLAKFLDSLLFTLDSGSFGGCWNHPYSKMLSTCRPEGHTALKTILNRTVFGSERKTIVPNGP